MRPPTWLADYRAMSSRGADLKTRHATGRTKGEQRAPNTTTMPLVTVRRYRAVWISALAAEQRTCRIKPVWAWRPRQSGASTKHRRGCKYSPCVVERIIHARQEDDLALSIPVNIANRCAHFATPENNRAEHPQPTGFQRYQPAQLLAPRDRTAATQCSASFP